MKNKVNMVGKQWHLQNPQLIRPQAFDNFLRANPLWEGIMSYWKLRHLAHENPDLDRFLKLGDQSTERRLAKEVGCRQDTKTGQ